MKAPETGSASAVGRALSKSDLDVDYDTDAKKVAAAVRRYWGDESVEVLKRALEFAKEMTA